MDGLTNKHKLILSLVTAVVFAALTVFSVLIIATGAMPSTPNGVKLVLFLGSAVAFLLFTGITIQFAVFYGKDRANDKRLIAAGLKQNPKEDVVRGRIIADDDQKGFELFEQRTEKFLANAVYPQGFTAFLNGNDNGSPEADENAEKEKPVLLTRYIERGGKFFVLADVYPQSELIKINGYILTSAEYYSQFNNVLFFADDESGHCHFLLDYGKGGEPKVKYLDDELDVVRTLAESFAEFTKNLKQCTYEEFCEMTEEHEKNKLKR